MLGVSSSVRSLITLEEDARKGTQADQASHHMDMDVRCMLVTISSRELAERATFEGLKARGKDGICQDCREAIPANRLAAKPFATRCTPCQEEYES